MCGWVGGVVWCGGELWVCGMYLSEVWRCGVFVGSSFANILSIGVSN